MPAGTGYKRATEFKAGGLNDVNLDTRWLIPHLCSEMDTAPNGAIMVQDLWATPADVRPGAPEYVYPEPTGSVHYIVRAQACSPSSLAAVDRSTISFVTAFFVVRNCPGQWGSAGPMIGKEALRAVADEVTEVIMPAYDDESYLVWRQNWAKPMPVRMEFE